MGMANALGYQFLDEHGKELVPIGQNLPRVKSIDDSNKHIRLKEVEVKVACDVTNPFYGLNGAAYIYAAQKGASENEIIVLNNGLHNLAEVIKSNYNIDLQKINGAGAAGGVGGGALTFLDGGLISGINLIKELADFDATIDGADWIITGEGQLDEQTLSGKTIDGVITSAKIKNIPVAALCGSVSISVNQQNKFGLTYVSSIVRGISTLQEAMNNSHENLVNATYNFASLLK